MNNSLIVRLYHERYDFTEINNILNSFETIEQKLAYLLDFKSRREQWLIDQSKKARELHLAEKHGERYKQYIGKPYYIQADKPGQKNDFKELIKIKYIRMRAEDCIQIVDKEIEKIERWLRNLPIQKEDIKPSETNVMQKGGIEIFFVESTPSCLLPFLVKEYTNSEPKPITILLYALHTLALIRHPMRLPKAKLHRSLKNTFGEIGTVQAYKYQIKQLDSASIDDEDEIKSVCKRIKDNCE